MTALFVCRAALLLVSTAAFASEDVYVTGFAAKRLYRVRAGVAGFKPIDLPGRPFDAVLSADRALLYVSMPDRDEVAVIRTEDDRPLLYIPVSSPGKLAIGNGGTRLYVASGSGQSPQVAIIDIGPAPGGSRRNVVSGGFDTGNTVGGFAVASLGTLLAVGTPIGNVLLYDTEDGAPRLLARVSAGARVTHLVFSPFGTKLYALLAVPTAGNGAGPGNVHVFRVPDLERKCILAAGPSELRSAVVSGPSSLFLTDIRGFLYHIDIGFDRLVARQRVGTQLAGIAASGDTLLIADPVRNSVRAINRKALSERPAEETPLEHRSTPMGIVAFAAR